jgi:hypothetical protein
VSERARHFFDIAKNFEKAVAVSKKALKLKNFHLCFDICISLCCIELLSAQSAKTPIGTVLAILFVEMHRHPEKEIQQK